jgi:hypothetical protein
MSHSDYCRLLHRTTNSSPALTEEKFMPKALITLALAACMASAAASYAHTPAPTAATAVTAEKPARIKLQPGADAVKVRAVYSPNIRPNPATIDELAPSESGWRSYGMLLGTLVLMGVIAVRRYKAGRP